MPYDVNPSALELEHNLNSGQAKSPTVASVGVSTEKADGRHFEALDGLRGVAALIVLVGHATAVINHQTIADMKLVAVWFFFMLSGFVIAIAYEDRLNKGMSLRRFAMARAIRLYPMLMLGALLGVAWFALGAGTMHFNWRSVASTLAAMAGMPGPKVVFNWSRFPLNPPEWSLFFELVMYAIFALGLYRVKTGALVAVVLICFVGFTVTEVHWHHMYIPMKMQTFGVIAAFVSGILLYRWHAQRILPQWPMPFWVLSLAILLLAVIPMKYAIYAAPFSLMVALPLVMIMGIADGTGKSSPLHHWLGEISYPLYITHMTVITAFAAWRPMSATGTVVLACVAAVVLAWLALVSIDKPVRRWLSRQLLNR